MVILRLVNSVTRLTNRTVFNQVYRNNCGTIRSISITRHLLADRKYTDKHEWVELDGNIGTVGISNYAQEALGDVVYAQLPDVSTEIKKGDECGALESVKAASEIYSPVSGKITAKNADVEETPSLINSSCYEKGWLYKIDIKDKNEINDLMTEEKYNEFLKLADDH